MADNECYSRGRPDRAPAELSGDLIGAFGLEDADITILGSDDADVVCSGDADEDDDYEVAMGPEDVDGVPDLVVGSHQNELSSGDEVTWAGAVYIISGVGM